MVALTFTNRATDEIKSRLDALGVERGRLWAGTIHSFALEWILRPYAPYSDALRFGFRVVDEIYCRQLLDEVKADRGCPSLNISTKRDRAGNYLNLDDEADEIAEEYHSRLHAQGCIDYDDILYFAFELVRQNEEIAATIGDAIGVFCVDEIQDTQDLQFGVLAHICRASIDAPGLFFVGDSDQCIYESLGAVIKTAEEIATEFELPDIGHLELTGNYRSTQRLIDYYRQFRPDVPAIKSMAPWADEAGIITFEDQSVSIEELPEVIAGLIQESLDVGIPASEICVVAPQWRQVRTIGRALAALLPDVDFDAPGLSPFRGRYDDIFFKISRLLLTRPTPTLYRTRLRWAAEVLRDLRDAYGFAVSADGQAPRQLLRTVNSVQSESADGLEFLQGAFDEIAESLGIDVEASDALVDNQECFFENARMILDDLGGDEFRETEYFRKLFRHPSGVGIGTCHGVKGEEYDTVIAFGLLEGYVPHWTDIINKPKDHMDCRASKMLFVICSRAKQRLHLIAESGHKTRRGYAYVTTPLLSQLTYGYDR